jgi:hypothetical protein
MLIQQGDVLISKVSAIPAGAAKVNPSQRGFILAEGESTGHAHVITDTPSVEMFKTDNEIYLSVLKEITVTHEEHKPVTVEPGIYQIGKVQEYDHFLEESKAVQD